MTGLEIHIVRHGDPDYENDALTELGRQEAAALAERMRALSPDALFTSPKGRARETAGFTADATGLGVEVIDWVSELDGLIGLDGIGDLGAAWNVPGTWVRAGTEGGRHWDRLPETTRRLIGKTTFQIGLAGDRFLERFGLVRSGASYRVTADWRPARIVVFCHAGSGLAWLAHLLRLPIELVWTGLHMAPTAVTRVVFERREEHAAAPRALSVGDVSHLYAAGLGENRSGLHGIDG